MRDCQELSDLPLQSRNFNTNIKCNNMPKQLKNDQYRTAKEAKPPAPVVYQEGIATVQSIYLKETKVTQPKQPKKMSNSEHLRNLIKKKLRENKVEMKQEAQKALSQKPSPKRSKYQELLTQMYGEPRGNGKPRGQSNGQMKRCESVKKVGNDFRQGRQLNRYQSQKIIQPVQKVPRSYLKGYRRRLRA